ncbi:MAG: hypothetical protein IPG79_03370 [Saprospiraceae bacterium]|nr:hypothetical protein [Saprospiraceae bacterium]
MKEALSLSVRYKKYTPECAAVLQPVINDLTKKLDSVACQKTLYEAEILINSGIEFKINKAVDMLLQISPSASCVKESLALSEKISNQRSLSAQAKAKMERYKIIIAEKKYNDWYELMEY